jgi:hypothetical protein
MLDPAGGAMASPSAPASANSTATASASASASPLPGTGGPVTLTALAPLVCSWVRASWPSGSCAEARRYCHTLRKQRMSFPSSVPNPLRQK